MSYRRPGSRRSIIALLASLFLLITFVILTYASDDATNRNAISPKWVRNLPAMFCPGASHKHCNQSSPVLADITGNGKLEIVLATNNGYVLAFSHDGSILWQTDTGPAFGMSSGTQRIASSPAVADIDKDGKMEIVVGAGTTNGSICTTGGVIVLDHNGRVQPGWPFITRDISVDPVGCPDTVYSTPALGDLDKNGDLEVVFGSFDHSVYALQHDGTMVAGFPPTSNHYARFGWWQLENRLADTIWSSPALADIDGDSYLDIVIGSDEGNYDSSHKPAMGNWTCPYHEPLRDGYCGGSIYVFDRKGQQLEGYPRYIYEIVQSTPAIMDINSDGRNELFFGTGTWYNLMSSDHPTHGFRLFAKDVKGNDLSGWQGGKVTGGTVAASPSVGDITGDGKPNIVVAASDQRLYAWHINGQPVSGFPMTPRNHIGAVLDGYNVGASFILADYTGDGNMEVFVRHSTEIIIINGKGQQLTAPSWNDPRPVFYANGELMNSPAVGDLNGDGHLELVAQNGKLTVWDLPSSSVQAHWPMYKQNAARTSLLELTARAAPKEFELISAQNQRQKHRLQITLYPNLGTNGWRVNSDQPNRISFPLTSGTIQDQKDIVVDVNVPAGLPLGENLLGTIKVSFTQDGKVGQTVNIPVRANVLQKLHQAHLPLVH